MKRIAGQMHVPEYRQARYGERADVICDIEDDGAGNTMIWAYLEGDSITYSVTLPYPTEDDAILFVLACHLNAGECSTLGPDEEFRGEKWAPVEVEKRQKGR